MKKIDKKKIASKGKGFASEFKSFVLRGNVVDMSIGVIIGGAFAAIVTAFTNDFINPLINSVGGTEIGGKILLPWTSGENAQYLLWGDFVTAVINFLIMALILFIILKSFAKLTSLGKKEEVVEEVKEPEPTKEEVLLTEIRDLLKKQNKTK